MRNKRAKLERYDKALSRNPNAPYPDPPIPFFFTRGPATKALRGTKWDWIYKMFYGSPEDFSKGYSRLFGDGKNKASETKPVDIGGFKVEQANL